MHAFSPALGNAPKTLASERRIALPTECINSLKIHQEQQQEERQAAGTGWTDNGLVFTTPTGRPLDPGNLTRRFRRLLHSAGLRTIRFHDLRHSTATLLLEQGVDLVVIKELLGHAHIGVTAGVYAHVRLRLQRQAIDTLSDALAEGDDSEEPPPSAVVVRWRSTLRLKGWGDSGRWRCYILVMRYADGGGLTAAGRAKREAVRFAVAEMFGQGVRPPEVARRLRVSRKSAYAWHAAWSEGGSAALVSNGPGGFPCRLDDVQTERLQIELEAGPAAHGWMEDQRWTLARVAELIHRLFGYRYTSRGVSYLLHRLGRSPQVPTHRAVERDEQAVERWRSEQWSRVRGRPSSWARG